MLILTGHIHEKKERSDEESLRVESTMWLQDRIDRHCRERQGVPVRQFEHVELHGRLLQLQREFIREPQPGASFGGGAVAPPRKKKNVKLLPSPPPRKKKNVKLLPSPPPKEKRITSNYYRRPPRKKNNVKLLPSPPPRKKKKRKKEGRKLRITSNYKNYYI